MKKHAFERGQTLPIVGIAAVLLVGAAGFAADVGYHQYEQRIQQTATDSAALAGAGELANGNYTAAGQRDAASNGFTDGSNGVTVAVGTPTPDDAFSGNAHAVEAVITAVYPTFFERVFGINTATVTTKAVAVDNLRSDLCMVALSTSGTTTINGHSTISAPNCTIAVNNSHLSIGGQSTITTEAPIQYSGSLTGAGTSSFLPSAPVSALPVYDPCPQITACNYVRQNPPATTPCNNFTWSATMSAGTYCGNAKFNGNTSLGPGTYVFTGNVTANNVTLTGTDVTIIVLSSNCPNINSATLNLAAPTSGSYAGLLFYDTGCSGPLTLNGGSALNPGLSGVIYAPNAALTMNAGATAAIAIIAGTFSLNSANTSFSPPPIGPVLKPGLVE